MSDDPVRRWRDDLAAWAIPRRILDQAPTEPWQIERAVFERRAAARTRAPGGISYDRAREALPAGGTVLDVGAGAGAASLPLLDTASALFAVDQDAQLLARLTERAGADREKVTAIVGSWPAVASGVPPVDVVVCHHVLYNVPDLRPFVDALHAHARRRVVIELTTGHPVARLNPLWKRFHGLVRPERPTWEDARRALDALHGPVQVARERAGAEPPASTWDELVASTCRRLCLAPARLPDVAAALVEQGARPDAPATWSAPDREVVTFWWDPA